MSGIDLLIKLSIRNLIFAFPQMLYHSFKENTKCAYIEFACFSMYLGDTIITADIRDIPLLSFSKGKL